MFGVCTTNRSCEMRKLNAMPTALNRNLLRLLLITYVLYSCAVLADEWNSVKVSDGAAPFTAKWCGEVDKIVWQSPVSGIHLATLGGESSVIKEVTSSWQHTKPFCSPDGRYVFFFDTTSSPALTRVLDTWTKKIQIVNGLNKKLVLSRDFQFALTTEGTDRWIKLPWGKKLEVVHVSPSLPGYFAPRIHSISPNAKKALLVFVKAPQKGGVAKDVFFACLDVESGAITLLSSLKHAADAKFSVVGNYLYVSAITNFQEVQKGGVLGLMDLYRLNVNELSDTPVRVASGIRGFDVAANQVALLVKDAYGSKISLTDLNGKHVQEIGKFNWEIDQISFSADSNSMLAARVVPDVTDGPEGPAISRDILLISRE